MSLRSLVLPAASLVAGVMTPASAAPEKILAHEVRRDADGGLLAWHEPETPGAAYDHVVRLAAQFVRDRTPVDPASGLPLYFISCSFSGAFQVGEEKFQSGTTWDDWMNNPACFFAGAVHSLAVDFHTYTGDRSYLDLVRRMLDHQLEHGTTPADWPWASVPYASGDPGSPVYQGATRWENEGMRGDGLHGIEPDKVGELGIGYLRFHQLTEEPKYLEAALACADALARHVRDLRPQGDPPPEAQADESPWPYRVNARTNRVIDPYTANVIEPIRLFDELLRRRDRFGLGGERAAAYTRARDIAWHWLFSTSGPLVTYVWNGYFEDVPSDPRLGNRVQNIPLETARYLLEHNPPGIDVDRHAQALAAYVKAAFGEPGEPSINEQTWCWVPMGSHTARYASIQALLHERTGDPRHREEAFRHFNWATYMTHPDGFVSVGARWVGAWWSDGYGDYIKHFIDGVGAVPEWAPADEDHLLRSSSVVQRITYGSDRITYRAFDAAGTERFRLARAPRAVTAGGRALPQVEASSAEPGWRWRPLATGGVLDVVRTDARDLVIDLK